jgi:thiol:disulfide interchange protein DsbD
MTALLTALVLLLGGGAPPQAPPPQRPRAELTPLPASPRVARGATATLSLRVVLPKDVHVQADKPRDPALIATALTFAPPAGVTVTRVRYPAGDDLVQAGQSKALLVFGSEFVIDVEIAVDRSVETGTLTVPAQLRYQACNDRLCFPPARAPVTWSIAVE